MTEAVYSPVFKLCNNRVSSVTKCGHVILVATMVLLFMSYVYSNLSIFCQSSEPVHSHSGTVLCSGFELNWLCYAFNLISQGNYQNKAEQVVLP